MSTARFDSDNPRIVSRGPECVVSRLVQSAERSRELRRKIAEGAVAAPLPDPTDPATTALDEEILLPIEEQAAAEKTDDDRDVEPSGQPVRLGAMGAEEQAAPPPPREEDPAEKVARAPMPPPSAEPITVAERSLTPAEARAAYDCMAPRLHAAYSQSGHALARIYPDFPIPVDSPYVAELLDGRYVQVHANDRALRRDLTLFLDRDMQVGSILAAPSFTVGPDGILEPGPLTLIEKMGQAFTGPLGNYRYTLIEPDGTITGATNGYGGAQLTICSGCAAKESDRFFLALLNGGAVPETIKAPAAPAGPASPAVSEPGAEQEPEPLDPNASLDPNAPLDPSAPLDPGAPTSPTGEEPPEPNAALDPNAPLDPGAPLDPDAPMDPNSPLEPSDPPADPAAASEPDMTPTEPRQDAPTQPDTSDPAGSDVLDSAPTIESAPSSALDEGRMQQEEPEASLDPTPGSGVDAPGTSRSETPALDAPTSQEPALAPAPAPQEPTSPDLLTPQPRNLAPAPQRSGDVLDDGRAGTRTDGSNQGTSQGMSDEQDVLSGPPPVPEAPEGDGLLISPEELN